MGTVILILLIVLNLVLFGYYCYQNIIENWVPRERIEQVKELYRQNGIELKTEPDRKNKNQPILILGEANLEHMVEEYLNGDFEKSFIYGSKVQYISENLMILTDRKNHSITYVDQNKSMPEMIANCVSIEEWARTQRITEEEAQILMMERAKRFAREWMGDDIELFKTKRQDKGFEYTFHPVQEDTVLFFNELKVWVLNDSVISAEMVYWDVTGETAKSYTSMPIDEILYALLGSIKDGVDEGKQDEVIQIIDGYQMVKSEEQAKAVPSVTIVMNSGREYVMNRTAA